MQTILSSFTILTKFAEETQLKLFIRVATIFQIAFTSTCKGNHFYIYIYRVQMQSKISTKIVRTFLALLKVKIMIAL